MIADIILLLLAGGLPYYILMEKGKQLSSKHIFLVSSCLLLCAIVFQLYHPVEHAYSLAMVSLLGAVFSIYKATKTTNFYKLGYYYRNYTGHTLYWNLSCILFNCHSTLSTISKFALFPKLYF